jgi:hypothetical protein
MGWLVSRDAHGIVLGHAPRKLSREEAHRLLERSGHHLSLAEAEGLLSDLIHAVSAVRGKQQDDPKGTRWPSR